MTEEQFTGVIETRIEKTWEVLGVKAKEYRKNNDPFHNFKRAAEMNRCTPERALMGMMAKHQISVLDMIDDIDNGKLPSGDLVSEKIGDHINYLILLEGMVYDRIEQSAKVTRGVP